MTTAHASATNATKWSVAKLPSGDTRLVVSAADESWSYWMHLDRRTAIKFAYTIIKSVLKRKPRNQA